MAQIEYTPEARQQRKKQLGESHSLEGVCKVYNEQGKLLRVVKTA